MVTVDAGDLVVWAGYLPHAVELTAADAPRVSISFNLIGGLAPPLTTLGHTWVDTDAAVAVDVAGAIMAQSRLPELMRLGAAVVAYHFGMQQGGAGIGAACAMATAAVCLGVEQHWQAAPSQEATADEPQQKGV